MTAEPKFEIDDFDGHLELVQILGREALRQPWRLEVHCRCHARPEDLKAIWALIGVRASLTLPQGKEDEPRTLKGIVDELRYQNSAYIFTLVPALTVHEDERDYRVFLKADAVSRAKEFFEADAYEVEVKVERTIAPRPQRVQFVEGGLPFIDRLLTDEGVVWFFDKHDSEKIVLTDNAQGFSKYEGESLVLNENMGTETSDTLGISVFDAAVRSRVRPQRVILTGWNYKTPTVDITASKATEASEAVGKRHHHAIYDDKAVGDELADAYLQAHRRRATVLRASINSLDLAPGVVIEIEPGSRMNESALIGDWLIVELESEAKNGVGGWSFVSQIVAVPAAEGYRPPPPQMHRAAGLQTMPVTGQAGEEIHTDEDGRALVKHRWDREHPEDESASAWQRVVQPAMPGGMLLPRVGFEAVSAFRGSQGDEPFLLGRLDNGGSLPNESLPAKKSSSGFGSLSTPGGRGTSGMSMDDSKGAEGMSITAQYNYDENSGNDKKATIVGLDKLEVGTDRTSTIGMGQIEDIGGAQSLSVGAQRTVNAESNINVKASDEIVLVGGARVFRVSGDQATECKTHVRGVVGLKAEACIESESRKILGAFGVRIAGSCNQKIALGYGLNVGGMSTENVAGAKCIEAAGLNANIMGKFKEDFSGQYLQMTKAESVDTFKGDLDIDAGGDFDAKGANVVFMADSFHIKAGGIIVKIGGGKINIDGDLELKSPIVQGSKVDT